MNALRTVCCVAALGILSSEAIATEVFDLEDNCLAPNCRSVVINGIISGNDNVGDPSLIPWDIQVFARPNKCLRLEVVRQEQDLVMGVVAPGGRYFFNDDRGGAGCSACPRVAISSTPTGGWYTVHISNFLGRPIGSIFTLRYGLYPNGNPNCNVPGAQSLEANEEVFKTEEGANSPPYDERAPSLD